MLDRKSLHNPKIYLLKYYFKSTLLRTVQYSVIRPINEGLLEIENAHGSLKNRVV